MSAPIYIGIAAVIALYFAASTEFEQGDHARACAALFFAALWPITIGFGIGMILRQMFFGLSRLVRAVTTRLAETPNDGSIPSGGL